MARSTGITRERVVEVAAELADAQGIEGFTLADVAARLGVRLPSLYNHVDGVAGLRHELSLLGARRLAEQLGRAAIGVAGDDAVLALALAYRAFVQAHPGLYAATVRAPAPADAELQQLAEHILTIVRAVLAPYRFDDQAMIHAIRGLRSIAHGFTTLELSGGFGIDLDRDESYARLVRAYTAGLRNGYGAP